jgi:membrane protease YdiL (CAAX protease family)
VLHFKEYPLRNLTFIFLFITTLIFFQLNRITIAFIILFVLLLLVVFLQEKQRIFVWITIAYFTGELLYLYGNRLLNSLSYHVNVLLMLDKLLLLFPIAIIFYVCLKFKQDVALYFKKPVWNQQVSFSLFSNQLFSLSVFHFLLAAISISIIMYIPFIIIEQPNIKWPWFFWIFVYAAICSIMEEVLWRGLIMTGMKNLTNESFAIFFSSAAYGFSYIMFGYSLAICMLIALFGCYWGFITSRSGSIIPAMLWHFVFQILMVLSGAFTFLPI